MATPVVIRSTAGTLDSPVGEVVAIASEHDDGAGTPVGRTRSSASPSTACGSATSGTSASTLCDPSSGRRSADVDVLFVPIGGGPTIGGSADGRSIAALVVRRRSLEPARRAALARMHYGNEGRRASSNRPIAFLDALDDDA